MDEFLSCDVLVVGAGPAGCSAGLAAKTEGLRVLIIERKTTIGVPVRCAEHIPALLKTEISIDPSVIVQSISTMRTILPSGKFIENPAPGYIINRDLFDQALAQKCREKGCEIITGVSAVGSEKGCVAVSLKGGGRFTIRPRIIIGADGPHSKVGRWMGCVNRDLIPAIQARVGLKEPMYRTEVYFLKAIRGGYGWVFPKGMEANVGIGMRKGLEDPSILKTLKSFLHKLHYLGKIDMKVKAFMAGWIPVRPLSRTVSKNIILAGDAAGQTHPITGAGVPQAVVCGKMAGEWAARAVISGDTGILKGYEEEWKDLYWESLDRAHKRRMTMESQWEGLEELLPRCWVGFKEYYRRMDDQGEGERN